MAERPGGSRRRAQVVLGFLVREATPDDADAMAAIITRSGETGLPGFRDLRNAGTIARALQTGTAILVAERDGEVAGLVRRWQEEGIAYFDLLTARRAGAGKALVRAVEARAQDSGLRLARCAVPQGDALEDYFGWLGYLPVALDGTDDQPLVVVERRLPLLTVREQRREDAAYIAEKTGRDSYVFEMGQRPGWFIASDGDRQVGLVAVMDATGGIGTALTPVLEDAYRGRGLEAWMLDRLGYHAEHAGYREVRVPVDEWLAAEERELEDRGWFREGDEFVRRPGTHAADEHDYAWPPEDPDD